MSVPPPDRRLLGVYSNAAAANRAALSAFMERLDDIRAAGIDVDEAGYGEEEEEGLEPLLSLYFEWEMNEGSKDVKAEVREHEVEARADDHTSGARYRATLERISAENRG